MLEREENIALSVSLTTRPPRKGEEDGRDYIFVDDAAFQAMIERDGFLEHAEVFGHRYGTPRAPVEAALEEGRDMLFDIDWQGAQQIAEKARTDLVGVFVLPRPSRSWNGVCTPAPRTVPKWCARAWPRRSTR